MLIHTLHKPYWSAAELPLHVCSRVLEVCVQVVAQPDEVASPVFVVIVKKVKHTAGAKNEQVCTLASRCDHNFTTV